MVDASQRQQISDLAALEEPNRRALYFFVADEGGAVSRDQAAQALGISRNLAGFHLDRLADDGWLEVSYCRLTGRSGPGAGRPSKLYRRAAHQIEISLPQREYGLAAAILAAAVDANHTPELADTLDATARSAGRRLGGQAVAQPPCAGAGGIDAVVATLAAHGYEPERSRGEVRLRNCPFHRLADQNKELVCGMNLSLIEGLVEALAVTGVRAVLEPGPHQCCVCLKVEAESS